MKASFLSGPNHQTDTVRLRTSETVGGEQDRNGLSRVAEAVLKNGIEPTSAQTKKSKNACLYRELTNVAYFTCICIMIYVVGYFLSYESISYESKEADFVTECIRNPENGSYSEITVVDPNQTADYDSTASNVSSLCLSALSFLDPFQALLKRTLAGNFSLQKIGKGITRSSYLLNELGERIAVLKPPFEGLNKECLVRDVLGVNLEHLTAPLAQVSIAGKVYMAVKYLKNLSLDSLSFFSGNVKEYLRKPAFMEDLQVIWLLDLIFKNSDRHFGNLLLTCSGVRAIDNDHLLARGASLAHNQNYLALLGLFDHEGLLPNAVDFLNSLTPEFLNRIASKYAKPLQEHFVNENPLCYWMGLTCDRGADHVTEFTKRALARVSMIKKMLRWRGSSLKSIAKALQDT